MVLWYAVQGLGLYVRYGLRRGARDRNAFTLQISQAWMITTLPLHLYQVQLRWTTKVELYIGSLITTALLVTNCLSLVPQVVEVSWKLP